MEFSEGGPPWRTTRVVADAVFTMPKLKAPLGDVISLPAGRLLLLLVVDCRLAGPAGRNSRGLCQAWP